MHDHPDRLWTPSVVPAARPASCVWHVVGLQRSVREWAMGQGWDGRSVRIEQAQGILVTALGVLAGWYGYGSLDWWRNATSQFRLSALGGFASPHGWNAQPGRLRLA